MQIRHMMLFAGVLVLAGVAMRAQQATPQAAPEPAPVMRTETRLVLVDAVVTDKKGNYVRDLTSKEFKVWEDNKEVTVKNFSFEADPSAAANAQKRYLILFFDNSTMDPGDQIRARDAAGKFIDSNAGPNRLMAIVNFGGSLRIAQNFTADADRLKKVVSGVKFSAVSPNAPAEVSPAGFPSLGNAAADFGARSVMLALRSMAKNLASVPGRKTLILFTSGFPLTPEYQSELTAVIDSCNKANVAVYPIDVRGLVAGGPAAALETPSGYPSARLLRAAYTGGSTPFRLGSFGSSFVPQHAGAPGGGAGGAGGGAGAGGARPGGPAGGGMGGGGGARGGTGGGNTGGGTTGGKGGGTTGGAPGGGKAGGTTGGTGGGKGGGNTGGGGNPGGGRGTGGYGNGRGSMPGQPYANNPYNLSRQSLVPRFPESASTNQQVLYSLAEGTGGFVIANTNDLLGGLEKIGKEQNEFYILAYAPTDSPEGSCHTLRVKVDRGGTNVRARSGYCNAKPVDLLAGDPAGKDLENRVKGTQPGTVTAAMRVPFFYTGENIARVNIAMEISSEGIQFEKVKKKFHSAVNVLGIAYRADNTVAARFSDTVKLDMENKKELEAFHETPLHYENQFEVASGTYTLKVVFSSGGESFGKLEAPLVIEPYDGKQFSMSGLALSKDVHRVSDLEAGLDAELLEGRTPLMTQGLQVTPTGASRFKTTDPSAIYVEIYEPLLAGPNPPEVGLQLRVLDRKSGEQKQDTGIMSVANSIRPDNPVIPVGVKLPVATLAPGAYRVELKAVDAAGRSSALRTADFEVE